MANDSQGSGAYTDEYIGSACGRFSTLPWLQQNKTRPLLHVSTATEPEMIELQHSLYN